MFVAGEIVSLESSLVTLHRIPQLDKITNHCLACNIITLHLSMLYKRESSTDNVMYLSMKSVNLSGGRVPACHGGVKCHKPLNKDGGGGKSNYKIMNVFHTLHRATTLGETLAGIKVLIFCGSIFSTCSLCLPVRAVQS